MPQRGGDLLKKIPMRKCVGCMEQKSKKELVRVVRSAEGEISVDLTGKKSGRGAYLCPNPTCLALARKAKRLERGFECEIPQEVYQRLEAEINQKACEVADE